MVRVIANNRKFALGSPTGDKPFPDL
jgi:hypothetical protein